jgi:hypothetical protein
VQYGTTEEARDSLPLQKSLGIFIKLSQKMTTKLYATVFFLALIVFSCAKKEEYKALEADVSDAEEIVIDTKNGKQIPFDHFIQNIEFLKLETTDDNLLGEISQVLFKDSLLIVVDKRISRTVQVYKMKGEFKYRIGNIGLGPGEYTSVTYVGFIPGTNHISVLDGPGHRVIIYDLAGKYISSHQTPFMLYYFEYMESGNKAYEVSYMRDPSVGNLVNTPLIVTDKNDKILYGACRDYSSEKFNFTMHYPLRKIGEDVYFSPNFTNTIYIVGDTAVKAKYQISIPGNEFPSLENMTNERFEEYREKIFFFDGDFMELAGYTYINIRATWGYPSVVYFHKTKETFLTSGNGNHPFFTFLSKEPLARYKDNCIVVDAQAYQVMINKAYLYKDGQYNELLDSLFENLTEDSNPVLFFYYFKPQEEL